MGTIANATQVVALATAAICNHFLALPEWIVKTDWVAIRRRGCSSCSSDFTGNLGVGLGFGFSFSLCVGPEPVLSLFTPFRWESILWPRRRRWLHGRCFWSRLRNHWQEGEANLIWFERLFKLWVKSQDTICVRSGFHILLNQRAPSCFVRGEQLRHTASVVTWRWLSVEVGEQELDILVMARERHHVCKIKSQAPALECFQRLIRWLHTRFSKSASLSRMTTLDDSTSSSFDWGLLVKESSVSRL